VLGEMLPGGESGRGARETTGRFPALDYVLGSAVVAGYPCEVSLQFGRGKEQRRLEPAPSGIKRSLAHPLGLRGSGLTAVLSVLEPRAGLGSRDTKPDGLEARLQESP